MREDGSVPSFDLMQLASQRFNQLNDAERLLLESMLAGQIVDFSQREEGVAPLESPTIRASLIRWLCVDTAARQYIDVRGVHIYGAVISGRLDLAFVSIPFPLALVRCRIDKGIDLTESEVRAIALDGTVSGPIAAAQARLRGSLYLRDGFHARGEVRLLGANIKGSLECRNARFENPGGEAISANGVMVHGSVFMDGGFYALGTVRMVGASIDRMWICSGGRFIAPHREALVADGISVGSSIMMESGFIALGEVRLMGATLGGDLSCRGGRMLNRGGDALSADGITIGGSANLNRGFKAIGRVRMVGGAVKRDLTCRDATLLNHDGDALVIDRARIDGNLYIEGSFRSNGVISMRTTRVNGDMHVWNACFSGNGVNGLVAENAHISGRLLWKGVVLGSKTQLNLAHARVSQLADEKKSWPYPGRLNVNGFVYQTISEGPLDAAARLDWLRRQAHRPFTQQPYEQLATVMKYSGHDETSVAISIGGEDDRLRYGELPFAARMRQWSLKYLLDYGYKPHYRALMIGTVLMLIGWLMFSIGGAADLMSPTRERVYMDQLFVEQRVVPPDYPVFNALVYSIDSFIPFINLHQEEYWLPNASRSCTLVSSELPCGSALRVYMWLHIGLGWVLATLFAVGLTGLVRKD